MICKLEIKKKFMIKYIISMSYLKLLEMCINIAEKWFIVKVQTIIIKNIYNFKTDIPLFQK